MNPFLRYLADKNSAHTQTDRHTDRQTDRQTDRHTPMITIPCGLRRAGNDTSKTAKRKESHAKLFPPICPGDPEDGFSPNLV